MKISKLIPDEAFFKTRPCKIEDIVSNLKKVWQLDNYHDTWNQPKTRVGRIYINPTKENGKDLNWTGDGFFRTGRKTAIPTYTRTNV